MNIFSQITNSKKVQIDGYKFNKTVESKKKKILIEPIFIISLKLRRTLENA